MKPLPYLMPALCWERALFTPTPPVKLKDYFRDRPVRRREILDEAKRMARGEIIAWGNRRKKIRGAPDFIRVHKDPYWLNGFHYWNWASPFIYATILTGRDDYRDILLGWIQAFLDQRKWWTHHDMRPVNPAAHGPGWGGFNPLRDELTTANRALVFVNCIPWILQSEKDLRSRFESSLRADLAQLIHLHQGGFRPKNGSLWSSYALFLLSLVFGDCKARALGLRKMGEHIRRSFESDGAFVERTPISYSVTCFRVFDDAVRLADRLRVPVPWRAAHSRLRARGRHWWRALMRPDGGFPHTNDGSPYYGCRPDLIHEAMGAKCGRMLRPSPRSGWFPESGFTVQRSGAERGARWMVVNTVPYVLGHSHYARGAMEVFAHGRHLLIDPGCGLDYSDPLTWTGFRATRSHNTVEVDGMNQDLKSLLKRPKAIFRRERNVEIFSLLNRSYETSRQVMHQRDTLFVRGKFWIVVDRLWAMKGKHTARWWLNSLEPWTQEGNGLRTRQAPGLLCLPANREKYPIESKRGKAVASAWNFEYARSHLHAFRATFDSRRPQTLCILLFPFQQRPKISFEANFSGSQFDAEIREGTRSTHLHLPLPPI